MAVERHDYAFPFRIDAASRQAQRTAYERHVRDMVIQLLLTSPGERADLPEFGCGLRALLFAPNSDAVAASAEVLVQQSLGRWLADHLVVQRVEVPPPSGAENELVVQVEYLLLATRATDTVDVLIT
jgi:uncharacterized protein